MSRRLQGPSAISQAAEAARAFGDAQWLAEDEMSRLCIVVEELVANLYDHGGLTERDEVELVLAVDPDGVRVSITDPGKPFDPWTMPRKSERTQRGGGAGIDIIKAWAHFISYDATGDGNRLEFLLPVSWQG
ncbi:MAG TPA: ATP-binding protein [Sphingomicrobium sp.]|nr:ATP-binding protein [Sphingomicrobium sp.]